MQNTETNGDEPRAPPTSADAQEQLEWRDLQNAQIESLKHVWDNPEDDCWNDVPSEATRLQAYPFTVQVDASRTVTVQLPADAPTGLLRSSCCSQTCRAPQVRGSRLMFT